jgi:hypothetical protein
MAARTTLRAIARVSGREQRLISASRAGEGVMIDHTEKPAALIDAVRALEGAGVASALIGGVAVGIHSGVPRATLDVDLAVRSTAVRATVTAAMQKGGFSLVGEHPHSINFRHRSGEPVQLAFDPGFDAMIDHAETIDFEGEAIPIVRKADLIAMKRRAAGDPARRRSKALRDQADVELLLGDVPDPDEGW